MASKLEMQEELRKKQFQARVMHERRRSSLGAEIAYDAERISKQQDKLRKQHERLENAKKHHKDNSFLTKDRRLSIQDDKLPSVFSPAVTPNISSISAHSPDYSHVKSRLFDHENSPRGRRLSIASTEGSPVQSPLPPRVIDPYSVPRKPSQCKTSRMSSHAINKTSYTEIVKNLSRLPHGNKGSDDDLERATPSRQGLRSRNTVSFREGGVSEASSPHGRTRRGSLQMSIPSSFQQKRRASLPASGFEIEKPPSRSRRHSLPANPKLLPKIFVDEIPATDADADETRLTALYNKAIRTIQLADETLLAADKSLPLRYKMRRSSLGSDKTSGSGFDLATLKELESILSDARSYSNRKGTKDEYSCLDAGAKRAQKKRIEHLEKVLKKLNPTYDTSVDIDPVKVLQCSYLRLSKSNVETLENMIKDQGEDPGIHIHMDVSEYDIWTNLKEERADLKQQKAKEEEAKQAQKLKRPVQI